MEKAQDVDIRWLTLDDIPEAAALEALCFPSFWTKEQFVENWSQPWFASYGCFESGHLRAYITLSVLAGEAEILNIAVHPEHRGRGLSRPLMAFALNDTLTGGHGLRRGLPADTWEDSVLEVRVGNAPAKALYRSLGYIEAGMRKRYYSDGEDALIMTLTSGEFRR